MEMRNSTGDAVTFITECVTRGNKTSLAVRSFLPWNNPANVIPRTSYLLLEEILFCVVNPILFVIGVPTNIVNLVIFCRQGLGNRMIFCLFSLALVDMLYVALCFLIGSFCLVGHASQPHELWWKWNVRKYSQGLCNAMMYSSGCLSMIIAVERCVCVWLPTKAQTLATTEAMACIVASTFLFLNLICLLYPLKFDVASVRDFCTGEAVLTMEFSPLYEQHSVMFDVIESLALTAVSVVTFIVVSLATAATVVRLRRAISWRQAVGVVSGRDRHQRSLAKMLVVLSCVYIIAASPNIPLLAACLLVEDFSYEGRYANIFEASLCICQVLTLVNSSVNFFVYVSRSARFRHELTSLLRVKRRDKSFQTGEMHDHAQPLH